MTTPTPQQIPGKTPVDPANDLLGIVPCELTTSLQQTPLGQRAALTVRTVDTTLTVFLAQDEVDAWVTNLTRVRARMTGLILGG